MCRKVFGKVLWYEPIADHSLICTCTASQNPMFTFQAICLLTINNLINFLFELLQLIGITNTNNLGITIYPARTYECRLTYCTYYIHAQHIHTYGHTTVLSKVRLGYEVVKLFQHTLRTAQKDFWNNTMQRITLAMHLLWQPDYSL